MWVKISEKSAVISLVSGILGLIFMGFLATSFGALFVLIGIIMGLGTILRREMNWMAIVGLALSILGFVLQILRVMEANRLYDLANNWMY